MFPNILTLWGNSLFFFPKILLLLSSLVVFIKNWNRPPPRIGTGFKSTGSGITVPGVESQMRYLYVV